MYTQWPKAAAVTSDYDFGQRRFNDRRGTQNARHLGRRWLRELPTQRRRHSGRLVDDVGDVDCDGCCGGGGDDRLERQCGSRGQHQSLAHLADLTGPDPRDDSAHTTIHTLTHPHTIIRQLNTHACAKRRGLFHNLWLFEMGRISIVRSNYFVSAANDKEMMFDMQYFFNTGTQRFLLISVVSSYVPGPSHLVASVLRITLICKWV